MIDLVANNIFVLIPLAIFIAFQVMEARKRAENSGEKSGEKLSEKDLELFEIEEEYGETESFDQEETYAPPPVVAKKEIPLFAPEAAPLQKETYVSFSKSEKPPIPQAVQANPSEKDLTEKLEHLSPLRKAIALSEILGPPKGI